jgi:hypothetical protein
MNAAVFEKLGLENLQMTRGVPEPELHDSAILIKVKLAGVNPFDQLVISGKVPGLSPMPHIPNICHDLLGCSIFYLLQPLLLPQSLFAVAAAVQKTPPLSLLQLYYNLF